MNIADTLRGLLRRWYVVVPGILIAVAGAIGAYTVIQPGYERTATQLLLPGEGTVPPGVTNPYLYLGGLTQGSDIVVRVMQGEDAAGKVIEEYPGTEVLVQRDPTVSGPVIQIRVTATTDEAAAGALAALVAKSEVVLEQLQTDQNVSRDDRMSISTLTQDTVSTLQQKTRLVMSAGVALGLVVLTLIVASLVDGLSRRPRRKGRRGRPARAAASGGAQGGDPQTTASAETDEPDEADGRPADAPVEVYASAEAGDLDDPDDVLEPIGAGGRTSARNVGHGASIGQ